MRWRNAHKRRNDKGWTYLDWRTRTYRPYKEVGRISGWKNADGSATFTHYGNRKLIDVFAWAMKGRMKFGDETYQVIGGPVMLPNGCYISHYIAERVTEG